MLPPWQVQDVGQMMTVRVRYLTKAGESGRRKKISSFGNIRWSVIGIVAGDIAGECLVGV
jgi:hypothetical protein